MAQADVLSEGGSIGITGWKGILGTVAAVFLAILFAVSGIWKISDPFKWSQFLGDFRVPSNLSMPFTLLLGIGETFGAALILLPRFRRWGAILIGLLLVVFMAYIGVNYGALVGKECSCFPIVKRTVGPGFFVGDVVFLLLAVAAGWWSRKPENLKVASMILGAIVVFAGVSYGMNAARQTGTVAPDSIVVDGAPRSLHSGNIFVFFYDPMCMHCDAAARRMAMLNWKDTSVIAIPVDQPQFAAAFLHDTGLKAGTSLDAKKMRDVFPFVNTPYAVALSNGRQKAAVGNFDESEPARTLRKIGFVE
ncbi:MAG TPA: DoxX family protein [Bryobacteraceae bacterium]|jgi:uncharacterized membrane protein YphA (DoxX/SURF4 family)|nr:DoxX family protein [Bryobacteraceae bacterium]